MLLLTAVKHCCSRMGCARDQPCRGCCLSRRQFSGSSVVLALYPDNFNLFLQAGDCVCFARWEKALLAAPKCLLCSAARCAQISAGVPEWQGLTPTLEKAMHGMDHALDRFQKAYPCAGRCREHPAGLACALERWLADSGLSCRYGGPGPAGLQFVPKLLCRALKRPTGTVAGRGSTMARSLSKRRHPRKLLGLDEAPTSPPSSPSPLWGYMPP